MTPTAPVTHHYRQIVAGGEYRIDFAVVAQSLLERLLAGGVLPAAPREPR